MTKLTAPIGAYLICSCLALSIAAADPPDSPRFEIASDPIGMFLGNYTLAATYAFADHIAVRGSVTHGNPETGAELWHVSASVLAYLDRAFHGPFLEGGFVWQQYHLAPHMAGPEISSAGNGPARLTSRYRRRPV
jgi:hypothetical protein